MLFIAYCYSSLTLLLLLYYSNYIFKITLALDLNIILT